MCERNDARLSHFSFWRRINQKTLEQPLPFPLWSWDPCFRVFPLSWKQQLQTQTFWEPDPCRAAHSGRPHPPLGRGSPKTDSGAPRRGEH